MNLVVDDAVEVKLKTKDTEERRRELGMRISRSWQFFTQARTKNREAATAVGLLDRSSRS